MTIDDSRHLLAESSQTAFNVCAVIIFAIMSFTFLFPCNRIIPLDRRTVSVFCATLCYSARRFAFRDTTHSIVEDVEFDVLVLLASIMAINHIVVHLKETNIIIQYIQSIIRAKPIKGFWIVSFAAFAISPFLTNDGVCLLFVEPILHAFEHLIDDRNEGEPIAADVERAQSEVSVPETAVDSATTLSSSDAIYFLLALACSSNIGSALTYTGNPQNMIVAQDSIGVLPPGKFLGIMLLPSLLSWIATTFWIQYCWQSAKKAAALHKLLPADDEEVEIFNGEDKSTHSLVEPESKSNKESTSLSLTAPAFDAASAIATVKNGNKRTTVSTRNPLAQLLQIDTTQQRRQPCAPAMMTLFPGLLSPQRNKNKSNKNGLAGAGASSPTSPLSPRRKRAKRRQDILERVAHVVSSPFPYMVLLMLAAMIVMIFVDVISISSLICISAMVMIVALAFGNHVRGRPMWLPDTAVTATTVIPASSDNETTTTSAPLDSQERVENINQFFEELFASLDYSLLLIFLGTFIVVANLETTGIPRKLWNAIVGDVPFNTASSIAGISLFVLFSSQLLGNVAVIQLAKPNIQFLGDAEKKMAWAILSFVATVGGNLTITGSAANIIVAEKSARIDPDSALDFFSHFRVCFWITIGCCAVGGVIIACLVSIDNSINHG